jgi:ABC-type phosphate/phosphonate transport system ATPase subunit
MTETTDMVQPGDMAGMDPAASELVVRIMQQNAKDAAWTTNELLHAYKSQAEHAEAALALIRDRIGALLDGPWMPTSHAIDAALYPSREQVEEYMKLTGGTN